MKRKTNKMVQYIWRHKDWANFRWNNGELAEALDIASIRYSIQLNQEETR